VKPRIVVSGVNLTTMGPLAVFKEALESLAAQYSDRYEIVALVHRRELLDVPNIVYLEFQSTKSSWFKRILFEYFKSKSISQRLKPYLWLSMDNVTPNVEAEIQAVYCHNPSPFYSFKFRNLLLDWKFGVFNLFFRYIYSINLNRNDYVIVQQDWIRKFFERSYGVQNVVVAHPAIDNSALPRTCRERADGEPFRFFYPAYPRPFKNAEIALRAAQVLEERGFHDFELWLTFEPGVNRYAKMLANEFPQLRSVRWLGVLPRTKVFELYTEVDCLLFPSKLETWGLPITEFKATSKPILAADLPYAHETVGTYDKVAFFDPEDAETLASLMKAAASVELIFSAVTAQPIAAPFSRNWPELWTLLLAQPPAVKHT